MRSRDQLLPDDDVAEGGEGDGEPDGRRVDDDAEASVEQEKACRRQAVALYGQVDAVDDVEEQGERQVGEHREPVGDGQAGKDVVGWRTHQWPRQHDDVGRVGHDTDHADGDGDVAVELSVPEEDRRRSTVSKWRPSAILHFQKLRKFDSLTGF